MNLKGIGDLMKQAQQAQKKMEALQADLLNLSVVGESGAGLVKVRMSGAHEVGRVEIDPIAFEEGREVLQDLLAAACNDAVRKVEAAKEERMSGVAGKLGLGLPF